MRTSFEENFSSTTTLPSDYEAVQGLCTVQLELKPGRSSAIATSLDVFQAAVVVLGTCVAGPGINTGGLAIDIGGYLNEKLQLTIEGKKACNRAHIRFPRRRQQFRRGSKPV